MRLIQVSLLAALVTGCKIHPALESDDEVAAKSQVKIDTFKRIKTIFGPSVSDRTTDPDQRFSYEVYLKSSFVQTPVGAKAAVPSFAANFVWRGKTWAFLDTSLLPDGTQLPTRVIDRDVPGASVLETLHIDLDRKLLEDKASFGLTMRVYGKRGEVTVTIPPAYIRGHLKKVDEVAAQPHNDY